LPIPSINLNTPPPVFIVASALITPLGEGIDVNFDQLIAGNSGIQLIDDRRFFPSQIPLSMIADCAMDQYKEQFKAQTRFDNLLLKCASDLQQNSSIDFASPDVLILLSSTKGNIELLAQHPNNPKVSLNYSASLLKQYFNHPNDVIIISNACISGISASLVAKRYLEAGNYKHAVVLGCDVLSHFVISGFNSFHALSKLPCNPFDLHRSGITLGEAAAGLVLSTMIEGNVSVQSGCISNDANHISGPSKTGEELSYCINQSLFEAGINHLAIDFILAHGTATMYNDEMESKALEHSLLTNVPVFSVKAVYGHTLGASGVLETLISAECLNRNCILSNPGFNEKGVSGNILISRSIENKPLKYALKTGSGFGGCNAAIILTSDKNAISSRTH